MNISNKSSSLIAVMWNFIFPGTSDNSSVICMSHAVADPGFVNGGGHIKLHSRRARARRLVPWDNIAPSHFKKIFK